MRCSNIRLASNLVLRSVCINVVSVNTVRNVGLLGKGNLSFEKVTFKQYFSFVRSQELPRQESSPEMSLEKLEAALRCSQVDKAFDVFNDFKHVNGFPDYSLTSALITKLLYSTECKWLHKAFDLVLLMARKQPGLLRRDILTKLGLSLARAQMPIQASTIVRIMLEKKTLPSIDMLQVVFLHMVKTETGTIIGSNLLIEICDVLQRLMAEKARAKLMRPDVTMFNLVMDACVNFGLFIKGLQIIEAMARIRVVADAHTIVIIAQIYEKNYMRDELLRFKKHIDSVHAPLRCHYGPFYDCLLAMHFIYDDIDAASALVLDIYKDLGFDFGGDKTGPSAVPIGSASLETGLKLLILPDLLHKDSVLKVIDNQKLVLCRNKKMALSSKALAKLIVMYKRRSALNKLSDLLGSIKNEVASSEFDNLCSEVIGACIHLEWLETAHDILDDLGPNWTRAKDWYFSLLTAYYDKKMFREGDCLSKQISKVCLHADPFDRTDCSKQYLELKSKRFWGLKSLKQVGRSDLAECVIQEMEGQQTAVIHEFNSSIHFFMKAKMIEDAVKTCRRMREMKVRPTVITFATLLSGYSSIGMYRDITILWGDIKRNMEDGCSMIYRDLYESLLLNFIRGGYFECTMEVIACMMSKGMYLDKWMYKNEYLKCHKDLYRTLKASNARNEVQAKRVEHVQAFRKLVGIR